MKLLEKSNFDLKIVLNPHLEIIDICDVWLNALDCEKESITGQDINLYLSEKNHIAPQKLDHILNKCIEIEMISSQGFSHFFEVMLTQEDKLVLLGRNISALRKYQSRFHLLEHQAKAGFWERNWKGKTVWTDEIYEIFELPKTPFTPEVSEKVTSSFVGHSRQLLFEKIERLFQEGDPYDIELEILTPKGSRKWVRSTGMAIKHQGKVIRGQGFIQDVTNYRENLIRLFKSQEKLHIALSANQMGVWQVVLKTRELIWDDNMHKIYGLKPEQTPKNIEEFYQLIHPEDLGKVKSVLENGISKGNNLIIWFRAIVNGEIRYIAARGGFTHSSEEDLYLGVNWDITKEKIAEETIKLQEAKIISAARLSSLGEMAGGIAHEINNPLSVILARTTQLKRRSLKGDLTHEELITGLSKVEETCNRIVSIINGLRTISRDGQRDPFERISLRNCLRDTISLISEKLRINDVQLIINEEEEELYTMGKAVQIEQVLMNIIHNSYDAVWDLEKKEINISLIKNHNKIEIRIKDSGAGVPDEMLEKIFMPFFTTKEIGKGTGIGLSISKSIIEEHQGEFSFMRTPSDWYFLITLPLA